MSQISFYLSFISLIVSVTAIIIAIWHNMKSFTPILTIQYNYNEINSEVSIVIQNKGIGPATITLIEFFLNDKSIGNNLAEIVNIFKSKELECSYSFQQRGKGTVLSAGETFTPIRFIFKKKNLPVEVKTLFKSISAKIWYKSLYGIEYHKETKWPDGLL